MAKSTPLDLNKDVTWWEASRFFWSLSNKMLALNIFFFLLAALSPVDDGWDAIPGLDIISIGDDAFIPFFIIWMFKGITKIKEDANRPAYDYVA